MVPIAANSEVLSPTLESLGHVAAAGAKELSSPNNASVRRDHFFDQNLTAPSLQPVTLNGESKKEEAGAPNLGAGTDYYFKGTSPLNGITIYTPVKGDGVTTGGESPTAKYGDYGNRAITGGVTLGVIGIGTSSVLLTFIAGLLIGAGAVLYFIFGKKK